MSVFIDRKFLGFVSHRLDQFKQKSQDLYNFRCPYCGDSKKNKLKAMREDMAKQHEIENKKIEDLNRWRWIVMGGAAVIGWIFSKVFAFK